jgi:peptide/nickel transport system substrate-binding protein
MKNMKIKVYTLIIAVLLMFTAAAFSPVQAQEISREDVYFHSSDWGPPEGWNPLAGARSWAWGTMYPTLYIYSNDLDEWLPYAAESYEWFDKYTLHVKIRDEAKWWDGQPVTAEDYKYSLELGKKYVAPMYTPLWDYIESVEALDEKTVQISTSDAKLNYFNVLNVLNNPVIVPKHIWEGLEAEYGDTITTDFKNDVPEEIVGAGPYKLMSWTEMGWWYERVDDWWGKDIIGLPTPKYLSHTTYLDNPAAALAFEEGELDVMTHFTPEIWEMWETKGLPVRTYYANKPYYRGGNIVLLYLNFDKAPLASTDLRRAVAHAIPYDDMISKAYYNYSVQAAAVPIIHTGPAAPLIDEDLIAQYGWEFDLDTAKQILDDAGIVDTDDDGIRELDGTPLSGFTIQVPYGWTDWMMICDMISTNLGEIGIGVETDFPDFSIWWSRLGESDWDFVVGWSGADVGYAHPWNGFRWLMDNRLSHPAGNWANYDNPDVISLIDAIPKESDAVALQAIYTQLQETWLTDLPGIPLFYGAVWYEYSEANWVGWPNEENGFWFAGFFDDDWPANMPMLFSLALQGETPTEPSWITDTLFTSDEIFADLAEAPTHGTFTVTRTEAAETVTSTEVVTQTTTNVVTETETETERETVPTTNYTTLAGAGVVALIIGVAVGWLYASRKT